MDNEPSYPELLELGRKERERLEAIIAELQQRTECTIEVVTPEPVFHRFCDLPKGTRFKYPDGNDVWIAIETYRRGLIAKHVPVSQIVEGRRQCLRQSLCCFTEDDGSTTLQTPVEVLPDDYFSINTPLESDNGTD
jgi:hypothetical protein